MTADPYNAKLAGTVTRTRRRILVIEDDPGIRTMLASMLRHAGYDTEDAATGHGALIAVDAFRPDLMVVDVMLPDIDGFEIARVLRTAGVTSPVVFLTARAEEDDRVTGLRAGGDDYVTKPFNVDELLLRIRGILRRRHPEDSAGADEQPEVLCFADLRLDMHAHTVQRAGRTIILTPTEFNVLTFLMGRPNHVVSKQTIIENVWGYDFDGGVRIVDTYLKCLRRKIDCFYPPLLHNVRGVGYCLRLLPGADPSGLSR